MIALIRGNSKLCFCVNPDAEASYLLAAVVAYFTSSTFVVGDQGQRMLIQIKGVDLERLFRHRICEHGRLERGFQSISLLGASS